MDGVARVKQSLSLGLSILLVFTIGPGAATSMAYQSAATRAGRRHNRQLSRSGRAGDRR